MFTGTVSYCPDDDKLRLYVGRVPRDEYEALRAAGFVSTPKQDCDFVATWTPAREDLARQYLEDGEDIGDEDYSPEERSADRAERFGGYRDKRADEAGVSADAFDAGPAAFGHQNRARAERQARRHDRHRTYAVSQWSKAEYWQRRTAGVIAHALYKSSAHVRRGRLLTLEAEQRKHESRREAYATRYATWQRIATMDGADELLPLNADGYADHGAMNEAQRLAYTVASVNSWWQVYHPTSEDANAEARRIWKHGFGAYDLLTKTEFVGKAFERLTPRQVAELYLSKNPHPDTPDTYDARWSRHYELRIGYEKAMLEAEGGMAGECDIEPGGWIASRGRARGCLNEADAGWLQVQRVHKSQATGRVTSVKVWGTTTGYSKESGYTEQKTRPCLVTIEVSRLGENAYRPPTDEERAAFKAAQSEAKAERKATAAPSIPLVNPTDGDAERLQQLMNEHAEAAHKRRDRYATFTPETVLRMTQAQYSAASKGSYSACEARTIHADGRPARRSTNLWSSEGKRYDDSLPAAVCKLRMRYDRVIVLTDKPQKPLPLDWAALADAAATAQAETVGG